LTNLEDFPCPTLLSLLNVGRDQLDDHVGRTDYNIVPNKQFKNCQKSPKILQTLLIVMSKDLENSAMMIYAE